MENCSPTEIVVKLKEQESNNPQDEALDVEGLRMNGYDVILCGTGLVQSILSCALTRAGKSVLHCDGNDFYGDMNAGLSLTSLIKWSQDIQHISSNNMKAINEKNVTTSYGMDLANMNIDLTEVPIAKPSPKQPKE